jgi:hypothetical protein
MYPLHPNYILLSPQVDWVHNGTYLQIYLSLYTNYSRPKRRKITGRFSSWKIHRASKDATVGVFQAFSTSGDVVEAGHSLKKTLGASICTQKELFWMCQMWDLTGKFGICRASFGV